MAAFNRPVPIFVFVAGLVFIGTLVALSLSRLLEGEGETPVGMLIKSVVNDYEFYGLFLIVLMFLPFFLLARLSALTYQTSSSVKGISLFVIFLTAFFILYYSLLGGSYDTAQPGTREGAAWALGFSTIGAWFLLLIAYCVQKILITDFNTLPLWNKIFFGLIIALVVLPVLFVLNNN